jgi:hypothetical protein
LLSHIGLEIGLGFDPVVIDALLGSVVLLFVVRLATKVNPNQIFDSRGNAGERTDILRGSRWASILTLASKQMKRATMAAQRWGINYRSLPRRTILGPSVR